MNRLQHALESGNEAQEWHWRAAAVPGCVSRDALICDDPSCLVPTEGTSTHLVVLSWT